MTSQTNTVLATKSRPHAAWPWGIWTIAACAVLSVAWSLGAGWLSHSVFGVPVGLWLVGLGLGIAGILSRRWPGLTTEDLAAWWTPASWRLAEGLERMLISCAHFVADDAAASRWVDSIATLHDRLPWWESPLRVGLDVPRPIAERLTATTGRARVQWFEVTSPDAADDPNAFCERHGLDAIAMATPSGGLRLVTLRRAGRDAAMPDWDDPKAVNLGTLFPHGADPACVELPAAIADAHRSAIELVAVLARSAPRLGLADRLAGRRPMPRSTRTRSIRPIDQQRRDTPGELATALVEAIEASGGFRESRALLRSVGAWAASERAAKGRFGGVGTQEILDRVSAANPGCEATKLRLAAARFAACDDHGGLRALSDAYELSRDRGQAGDAHLHAVFLDEALALSPADPASVGRVAAGITLLMAATDPEQLDYLHDDLMDEARHAEWLIGRDQDSTLLDHVFRTLSKREPPSAQRFPRRAA